METRSDLILGPELLRCRPKPLWKFFSLHYQGMLPPFKWCRFLNPIITVTSPIADSFIAACLPLVLSGFLFQVVLGLKPPDEPSWTRPFYIACLAISAPLILWWYWASPRNDGVTVCERGFRWRISLSRWNWFRSEGTIAFDQLESFSYRSDCFDEAPIDSGKTTAQMLERLWLELHLGRHDIAFHLKNGDEKVVEHFFARLEPNDLERLLAHLATVAESHRILVVAPNSAQAVEESTRGS
jgi:hypothetical protein